MLEVTVDKTMLEVQLPHRVAKVLSAIRTMLEVQQLPRIVLEETVDKTMLEEQLPHSLARVLNAIRTMLEELLQTRTV